MHASFAATERPTLRFDRHLNHPPADVWAAITEPDQLSRWFPSKVIGTLGPGATIKYEFEHVDIEPLDGEVTLYDPPRKLSFTWGGDHLHFELEPQDDAAATLLRFTVELDTSDKAARDAAGWHVCLDRLEAGLTEPSAGAPGSQPTEEWQGHYEEYSRRGFPATAPIPE